MPGPAKLQAAGIVVYKLVEGRILYLLLQTSYMKHHWTPPKGFVDDNEDILTTALRETQEEAGLSKADFVLDPTFKESFTYFDPSKQGNKTAHYFLARVADPAKVQVTLSGEHQDYKWLDRTEASQYAEHADMAELFRKAELFIHSQAL
ncbi:putative Bis(5'-nucleosyl)-tetraphosphatase (asymmetrical) [Hypsibius exemplaris]|uniref:Bis(5'-nucleosyl)-tetraphosphatase [asymmetrical] n=1 Tax=Hypsibius exemplaris TaxID=2072580 RepID=A0A1W0WF77_HYPEX|nr:putative Bis(5'-nucleosyl)-tetraphosphatase (asymmetrical) [Hypsibius exemplaris]